MDTGAWRATVYRVAKKSNMTEQLNNNKNMFNYGSCLDSVILLNIPSLFMLMELNIVSLLVFTLLKYFIGFDF